MTVGQTWGLIGTAGSAFDAAKAQEDDERRRIEFQLFMQQAGQNQQFQLSQEQGVRDQLRIDNADALAMQQLQQSDNRWRQEFQRQKDIDRKQYGGGGLYASAMGGNRGARSTSSMLGGQY